LFWVPADYIGNNVVRIIVKVLIAIVCGFVELGIFANATVPWLEGKEANKPRIRRFPACPFFIDLVNALKCLVLQALRAFLI
jgi:hypothetical protein